MPSEDAPINDQEVLPPAAEGLLIAVQLIPESLEIQGYPGPPSTTARTDPDDDDATDLAATIAGDVLLVVQVTPEFVEI